MSFIVGFIIDLIISIGLIIIAHVIDNELLEHDINWTSSIFFLTGMLTAWLDYFLLI